MEDYSEYMSWAREHLGVRTADGVAVSTLPAPYFRGVITTKPISKGSTLISVPLSSTLSMLDLKASPVLAAVEELAGKHGVPLSEDNTLALLLIHEAKVKGEGSKYARHIAALPSAADIRNPFSFSDEELAAFDGTNLGPYARAMKAQVASDFAQISSALAKLPDDSSVKAGLTDTVFTLETYTWALSNIWSRFVSLVVNRRLIKAMIPCLDMLNHSPTAKTRHAYDAANGCISVVTEAGIPAGSQVCLYYGDLSAYEALRLYGMPVLGHAPSERCMLQMGLPAQRIPGFQQRFALLSKFCGPPQGGLGAPLTRIVGRSGESISSAAHGKFELVRTSAASVEGGNHHPAGQQLLRAEFDLSADGPHRALLRAMRILNAPEQQQQQQEEGSSDINSKNGNSKAGKDGSSGKQQLKELLLQPRGGAGRGGPDASNGGSAGPFAYVDKLLSRSPDAELSPAHEAAVLDFLLSNLRGMLSERLAPVMEPEAAAADDRRVQALQAGAAAGPAALEAFFDDLRAKGVIKGPKVASTNSNTSKGSEVIDSDDEDDSLPSLSVGGGGGKGKPKEKDSGGKKKGKGAGAKDKAAASAAAAGAAPSAAAIEAPTAAEASTSAPAPAVAPAAPLPLLSPHEYVLSLAAYLRSVEVKVLSAQIGMLEGMVADAQARAGIDGEGEGGE